MLPGVIPIPTVVVTPWPSSVSRCTEFTGRLPSWPAPSATFHLALGNALAATLSFLLALAAVLCFKWDARNQSAHTGSEGLPRRALQLYGLWPCRLLIQGTPDCGLRHNFAAWQGYGLFGPEQPSRVCLGFPAVRRREPVLLAESTIHGRGLASGPDRSSGKVML